MALTPGNVLIQAGPVEIEAIKVFLKGKQQPASNKMVCMSIPPSAFEMINSVSGN